MSPTIGNTRSTTIIADSSRKRPRDDNRSGNRWDSGGDQSSTLGNASSSIPQPPPPASSSPPVEATRQISEDDAVAALISSAQSHLESRQVPQESRYRSRYDKTDATNEPRPASFHQRQNRRNDYRDDGTENAKRSRRRRWGDEEGDGATSRHAWGARDTNHDDDDDTKKASLEDKQLANFGLSGALAKDSRTGNTYNGIVLKFSEPPEARTPHTKWRLYVFKKRPKTAQTNNDDSSSDLIETLHIAKQSAYLFGRERKVADVLVEHGSLSRQHCVLQYRAVTDKGTGVVRCLPYLMDLGSAHGTFVNGSRLESARYYELRKKDVITLGASSREYVLMTENTT